MYECVQYQYVQCTVRARTVYSTVTYSRTASSMPTYHKETQLISDQITFLASSEVNSDLESLIGQSGKKSRQSLDGKNDTNRGAKYMRSCFDLIFLIFLIFVYFLMSLALRMFFQQLSQLKVK